MQVVRRGLTGRDYLSTAVELLRGIRLSHPTAGVWEAADLEWWWRKPRRTDDLEQLFWFDDDHPVAAATTTDWGGRIGLDIITMPHVSPEVLTEVFHAGLAKAARADPDHIEVMIDDADSALAALLANSGFSKLPESGSSAWMPAANRPAITPLADGYQLLTRDDLLSQPHHFLARNGPEIEHRLNQTSMYRADLDLAVVDEHSEVVGYGLFWHDPVTNVGFVEPLGVEQNNRRLGLAQHILTAGLDRLALAGATRLKINFENDNPASTTLYPSLGFTTALTTSFHDRQPGSSNHPIPPTR